MASKRKMIDGYFYNYYQCDKNSWIIETRRGSNFLNNVVIYISNKIDFEDLIFENEIKNNKPIITHLDDGNISVLYKFVGYKKYEFILTPCKSKLSIKDSLSNEYEKKYEELTIEYNNMKKYNEKLLKYANNIEIEKDKEINLLNNTINNYKQTIDTQILAIESYEKKYKEYKEKNERIQEQINILKKESIENYDTKTVLKKSIGELKAKLYEVENRQNSFIWNITLYRKDNIPYIEDSYNGIGIIGIQYKNYFMKDYKEFIKIYQYEYHTELLKLVRYEDYIIMSFVKSNRYKIILDEKYDIYKIDRTNYIEIYDKYHSTNERLYFKCEYFHKGYKRARYE